MSIKVTYVVYVNGKQTTFDNARDAARAFHSAKAEDAPLIIRVERSPDGRESASVPGQTHWMERNGVRTYWKDLGGHDEELKAAYATELVLPSDDAEFDAYMASEKFHGIQSLDVMEQFLIRAARRYHALRVEWLAALDADDDISFSMSDVKCRAYAFCCDQFENVTSDLRMFFSETEGFWDQSPEERSRLYAIADALVCSAKDVAKIDQAERLIGHGGE